MPRPSDCARSVGVRARFFLAEAVLAEALSSPERSMRDRCDCGPTRGAHGKRAGPTAGITPSTRTRLCPATVQLDTQEAVVDSDQPLECVIPVAPQHQLPALGTT